VVVWGQGIVEEDAVDGADGEGEEGGIGGVNNGGEVNEDLAFLGRIWAIEQIRPWNKVLTQGTL
jgi:hypothetical protein